MKRKSAFLITILTALLIFVLTGIQAPQNAEAQFTGSVYINPDGTVTGTKSIQQNGNVYTLTENISGGIQAQKSNIVIDGAGFTIWGNGMSSRRGIDLSNDRGSDPSRPEITNVTIKNLIIVAFDRGIENINTNNNTITGNIIANCATSGINIIGSPNNVLITNNTIANNGVGISLAYAGGDQTITGNNFINNSISVWLSATPNVDANYWSDYIARYPNVTEIDNSGIGNIPYVSSGSQDNHPLMKPIAPLEAELPTTNSIPTISPTSTSVASLTPTQTQSSTASPLSSPTETTPTVSFSLSPSIPEFPLYWIFLPLVLMTLVLAKNTIEKRKAARSTSREGKEAHG